MSKILIGNVRGKPGADGTNGTDGFSPTIEVERNTDTEYALNITTKDGKITTPNLKGANGKDSYTKDEIIEMVSKSELGTSTAQLSKPYITVYVNANTGDDLNTGGSESKAMKTFAGVVAKYPLGNLVIVLSGGKEYEIDKIVNFNNRTIMLSTGSSSNPAVIKGASSGITLFRLNSSTLILSNVIINLNDGDSFLRAVGNCSVSIGDYYAVGFYMTGTGTAKVISVYNVDINYGNGLANLFLNLRLARFYGQDGTLNVLSQSSASSRCLAVARISGVTKDSNAFWVNGSDTAMSQINDTTNYVVNW